LGSLSNEWRIHFVFVLSILLKAVNGVVEIVFGIALVLIGATTHLVQPMVRGELIEDPSDLVAGYIQHLLYPFLAHSGSFAAVYLLSHGLIKLFLAASLLRDRLWAYPAAIAFFILFIIYQMYRFSFTHSVLLILLTVFDIVVIVLTWHEFGVVKGKKIFSSTRGAE
jgi:uncharacterized membrane protein